MSTTARERTELRSLMKSKAKLESMRIDQRAKAVEADFEQQLATQYDIKDAAWAELTDDVQTYMQEADRQLAERCRRLGIPTEFRPKVSFFWHGRGENGIAQRRTELRRVAVARIQALAREAKAAIEMKALEFETALVAGALESEEAQAFLAKIPSVEALMPALDLKQLEAHR